MANPVTYNQGTSIAGSLKSSVISVGVTPSLNISGYNWRNGFENNNIWVIYSDTYSQGQTTQGNAVPTIWATPVFTDAGLLNLINVLPARAGQTAFTTLSSAISWLYGENKYFLSNQNYPQIVTDGLSFIVDAGFAASYPNAGTSTYDLSVQQFTNSLQNGTVWVNNNTKSYFDFDGADDQIVINSPNNFNNITWSAGMTVQVLYKIDDLNDFNGQFRAMIGTDSSPRSFNYYLYGPSNPATTLLYHFSANFNSGLSSAVTVQPGRYYLGTFSCGPSSGTYYHNLNVVNTQAGSTPQYYTGTSQFLGRADNLWKGNIGNWKIYNKALSDNEIAQNYYQGPIVTTNLSYLWDAGNLISYYTGSSTTYDMLNTGVNGTLQNGVGYSGNYGGYWQFDGSDDRIILSSSITLGNGNTDWTVNAWMRTTATASANVAANPILSNTDGGPIYSSLDVIGQFQSYWAYPSNIGTWKLFQGNVVVNDGQWHMLTWVNKSNQTMDFYVDGVYDTTVSPVNVANNNPLNAIGYGLGNTFVGSIAMVQVNKGTAMNASQVSQQYGATRGRFQSYQAYANGGTVTTITQNGVNYRVHTFTSSGTLSVTQSGSVEVLVVAGGASGGGSTAGGGGAGGLIYDNSYYVNAGQTITVTVGAGGAGVGSTTVGNDGNNSVFGDITATGGGGGGMTNGSGGAVGRNGGSGGGGAHYVYMNYGTPGTGIPGQGYDGGNGSTGNQDTFPGGGGGGAGGKGGDATTSKSGNGGIGQPYGLTGTTVYYAGGGGGGSLSNGGDGGLGGGAAGTSNGTAGATATVNTGGGGGGGWFYGGGSGGAGGSGLIIVRYPIF
jgi:hypothetical protein